MPLNAKYAQIQNTLILIKQTDTNTILA